MPAANLRPPSHDAVQRARAWLDRQHDQARRQVLRLLCETPAEAISQALSQLSTGELRALAATLLPPRASGWRSRHPQMAAIARDWRIVTARGYQPPRAVFCDAERFVTRPDVQ